MRFKSNPPASASAIIAASPAPDPSPAVVAAAAIDATTGAATSIALRLPAPFQPASETATPFTAVTSFRTGSASRISKRSRLPWRVTFCGAAGSMRFSRSGKKRAFAGNATPSGALSTTTSAPPCSAACDVHAGTDTGSMLRARSICACQRGFDAASVAATGNAISSSPFSGMQMSLHTSHSAFAPITALPGVASAGGVTSASSTTSSS